MLPTESYQDVHPKKMYGGPGSTDVCTKLYADVGGAGGWHKAWVLGCSPLAAPIGLSPLLILTLCGPERVLVVSMEPPDDLSCLTTPGDVGGGGRNTEAESKAKAGDSHECGAEGEA